MSIEMDELLPPEPDDAPGAGEEKDPDEGNPYLEDLLSKMPPPVKLVAEACMAGTPKDDGAWPLVEFVLYHMPMMQGAQGQPGGFRWVIGLSVPAWDPKTQEFSESESAFVPIGLVTMDESLVRYMAMTYRAEDAIEGKLTNEGRLLAVG
ncbi:MAG: hypothetical protein ABID40_04950, partial [Candidatus Bipolaricaulota bacterium]